MARSLEILLFNRRLRKNISTRPNQTNQIVHPTSSTPQLNTPHNVTTTKTPSRKRSRRKNTKKPPTYNNKPNVPLDTSSVINLSNVTLTNDETQLLAKELTFCPKPRLINWTEVNADFNQFARRMRITEFFHDHSTDNESNPFYPKSLWTPPTDRDDVLNAFLNAVKHDLLTTKPKYIPDNLPKAQRRALHKLKRRHDIVIKSADKGSATVIMDRTWYLDECHRQLNNPSFYEQQDTDLTDTNELQNTSNACLTTNLLTRRTNSTSYIEIPNPDVFIFYLRSTRLTIPDGP